MMNSPCLLKSECLTSCHQLLQYSPKDVTSPLRIGVVQHLHHHGPFVVSSKCPCTTNAFSSGVASCVSNLRRRKRPQQLTVGCEEPTASLLQPDSSCSEQDNLFIPKENWPVLGKRRLEKRILPPVPVDTFSEGTKEESGMRIYALSDLHTDYHLNLEWIQSLSKSAYQRDALIVAGDVSDSLDAFRVTMAVLKERFEAVFFVPGNHDLWCKPGNGAPTHSLVKLDILDDICTQLGIDIRPRKLPPGVWIVPILSWHHQSFDREEDIEGYSIPAVEKACMDYRLCKWPSDVRASDDSVAQLFDDMNDNPQFSNPVAEATTSSHTTQVISFSHFLPRLELCPEKRFLYYPNLPKIVGSDFLEKRVRDLHGHTGSPSACHIFGHTHFAWDATLDGIRYIQAPLAYPKERQRRINGGQDWLPLMLYDADVGTLCKGPISCEWSNYYRSQARDPSNMQLAPWVRDLYKPLASV